MRSQMIHKILEVNLFMPEMFADETESQKASQETNDNNIDEIIIKIDPEELPHTYENEKEEEPIPQPTLDKIYWFFCDRCQKGYKQKHSLLKHLASQKNCTEIELVPCKTCDKMIAKGYLRFHVRSHTRKKPYTCDICFKKFSRSNHLADHKLIHRDERPYSCKVCQRRFTQKAHLTCHMVVHTGEKQFTCDICTKSFARNSYLVEHKRVHSGEKPFYCDVCHKSYSRRRSFAQHKLIHKKIKPFSCDICQKEFSQKINLQTHLSRHTSPSY